MFFEREVFSTNVWSDEEFIIMKKMSHWGKSAAFLALGLSAIGSLNASATAVPNTTTTNIIQDSKPTSFQPQSNFQLAQGGLVGQCRAAKDRIFVYTQRSTTSQTLRTLAPNEQVTLADNGTGGWIAISAPATGYVQAANLKSCTTGTGGTGGTGGGTQSNVCRVANVALAVRQGPGLTAASAGGVAAQQTVRLANPQQSQTNSAEGNRTWVRIVAPRTGWISSGFPEGNLGPRFNCP